MDNEYMNNVFILDIHTYIYIYCFIVWLMGENRLLTIYGEQLLPLFYDKFIPIECKLWDTNKYWEMFSESC